MTATGWIATAGTIVGNVEHGIEIIHHWDGTFHRTRKQAIRNGFRTFGSDDFNVAHVKNGVVTWVGWMNEEHADIGDREEVAHQFGWGAQ